MRTNSIVILVILAVVFPTATSYAQPSSDEQPQAEQPQDGRYLIYMRGIT